MEVGWTWTMLEKMSGGSFERRCQAGRARRCIHRRMIFPVPQFGLGVWC